MTQDSGTFGDFGSWSVQMGWPDLYWLGVRPSDVCSFYSLTTHVDRGAYANPKLKQPWLVTAPPLRIQTHDRLVWMQEISQHFTESHPCAGVPGFESVCTACTPANLLKHSFIYQHNDPQMAGSIHGYSGYNHFWTGTPQTTNGSEAPHLRDESETSTMGCSCQVYSQCWPPLPSSLTMTRSKPCTYLWFPHH